MSDYEIFYSSNGQCPKCGETMLYVQYDQWPSFDEFYICEPCDLKLTPHELQESESE